MKQMPPKEEMAYYHLARQHRFLPLIYAYRPKLAINGGQVQLDWTEYDARVAPYLDGTAFTEKHGYWGPGYGVPVDHMMLPFDIEKHGVKNALARGTSSARAVPRFTNRFGRRPESRSATIWIVTPACARS